MEKFNKEQREFVVPGEVLIESMEYLPGKNCFRDDKSIVSNKVGLVNIEGRVISVVPLNGVYIPQRGDMVVAIVEDIQGNGWVINVNSAYEGYMPLSGVRGFVDSKADFTKIYNVGDVLYGKISNVSCAMNVHLSMVDSTCRKLQGGRIVTVNAAKVPRIIGKKGSMIDLIKNKTGCTVIVGQNGMIWLDGSNQDIVLRTINYIEENSHLEGLTLKVEEMLNKEVKK